MTGWLDNAQLRIRNGASVHRGMMGEKQSHLERSDILPAMQGSCVMHCHKIKEKQTYDMSPDARVKLSW